VKLFGKDVPYEEVAREVEAVEGVLATGLFVGTATAVVVADPKGPITYVQV
jgi:ribose 5-phosphate isomerase